MRYINDDVILACGDLVGRTGATAFEIGYVNEDVPTEDAGWYACAQYRGARLIAEDHRSPNSAALELAQRLLSGATCKCGRPVTLSDGQAGCRWKLVGPRWESGCSAPPIHIKGQRGDVAAMRKVIAPGQDS